jgi:general secretion pathway protein D
MVGVMKLLLLAVLSLSFFTVSECLAVPRISEINIDKGSFNQFIDWYSERTGFNIVVGDGVEPLVNVAGYQVVHTDLPLIFKGVLDSNNLEQIKDGKNIYIKKRVDEKLNPLIEEIKEKEFVYKVYILKSVPVSSVFTSLENFAKGFPFVTGLTAFPKVNGFGVYGPEMDIKTIDDFVSMVDVRYRQILVEAIITEIEYRDSYEVGGDLVLGSGSGGEVVSSLFSGVSDLSNLPSALVAAVLDAKNYRALVRVLETADNARLLSTPRIVVNDGERGEVFVGENVPFVTGQAVGEGVVDTPFQTIQRADVGLKLVVVPLVVNDGLISLEILQESSSVTESTLASDIITNKRMIKTKVDIVPGQVLCLGGLRSDDSNKGRRGVPFLSKVPFVGWLFQGVKKSSLQRNMNVFLRVSFV